MIKTIELRNFQSHKDTELTLDSGVNVIVGPSDSGKTAIIRALHKLVWNRPLGDAFRSHWGGHTQIKITINDDHTIMWYTDNNGMGYSLDNQTHFKAVGTSVPDEIVQALNLNEINLQQQLDQPFLLTSSPGEVAQHFNRIAHLDQIDRGLTNVQKWLRQIEQDRTSAQRRQDQLKDQLKEFDHLDLFEEEVEVIEGVHQQMIFTVNDRRELERIITDIDNVESQITEQAKITEAGPLVDQVLGFMEIVQETQEKAGHLQELLDTLTQVTDEINDQQEITKIGPLIDRLLQWTKERNDLDKQHLKLSTIISDVKKTEANIKQQDELHKKLHERFHQEMGDTCILCGQKINKT